MRFQTKVVGNQMKAFQRSQDNENKARRRKASVSAPRPRAAWAAHGQRPRGLLAEREGGRAPSSVAWRKLAGRAGGRPGGAEDESRLHGHSWGRRSGRRERSGCPQLQGGFRAHASQMRLLLLLKSAVESPESPCSDQEQMEM